MFVGPCRLSFWLFIAVILSNPVEAQSQALAQARLSREDLHEIARVSRGMLEAWYGGNEQQMDEVLHKDLAKRGVVRDSNSGQISVSFATKADMVQGARDAVGKIPRERWNIEVTVLDATDSMATARVKSEYLLDICQLAKINGRWQIINVLWETIKTPPWLKTAG